MLQPASRIAANLSPRAGDAARLCVARVGIDDILLRHLELAPVVCHLVVVLVLLRGVKFTVQSLYTTHCQWVFQRSHAQARSTLGSNAIERCTHSAATQLQAGVLQ